MAGESNLQTRGVENLIDVERYRSDRESLFLSNPASGTLRDLNVCERVRGEPSDSDGAQKSQLPGRCTSMKRRVVPRVGPDPDKLEKAMDTTYNNVIMDVQGRSLRHPVGGSGVPSACALSGQGGQKLSSSVFRIEDCFNDNFVACGENPRKKRLCSARRTAEGMAENRGGKGWGKCMRGSWVPESCTLQVPSGQLRPEGPRQTPVAAEASEETVDGDENDDACSSICLEDGPVYRFLRQAVNQEPESDTASTGASPAPPVSQGYVPPICPYLMPGLGVHSPSPCLTMVPPPMFVPTEVSPLFKVSGFFISSFGPLGPTQMVLTGPQLGLLTPQYPPSWWNVYMPMTR